MFCLRTLWQNDLMFALFTWQTSPVMCLILFLKRISHNTDHLKTNHPFSFKPAYLYPGPPLTSSWPDQSGCRNCKFWGWPHPYRDGLLLRGGGPTAREWGDWTRSDHWPGKPHVAKQWEKAIDITLVPKTPQQKLIHIFIIRYYYILPSNFYVEVSPAIQ